MFQIFPSTQTEQNLGHFKPQLISSSVRLWLIQHMSVSLSLFVGHELVYDTILSLDFESTMHTTSKAANNVGGVWSVMILVDCETQPSREKYTQVLLSTLETTMYRSGHVVWPIPQASGRKLRSGTGCARGDEVLNSELVTCWTELG